jgi:hypothetical protein
LGKGGSISDTDAYARHGHIKDPGHDLIFDVQKGHIGRVGGSFSPTLGGDSTRGRARLRKSIGCNKDKARQGEAGIGTNFIQVGNF